MVVFVSGATGVLGRATIPVLVAGGASVRGLATSREHEARLRSLGAEAVRADLFSPSSLMMAVSGCEAVLHLATKIPPANLAHDLSSWQENDRIRREGTRN